MAKKHKDLGPSLLDVLEVVEVQEHAAECEHRREKRSSTIWKGETFHRQTMTCEACGRIRGRFPGE